MFIDRARIFVQSGKGGDGMSSFRHEKFVPKGGPNGGDGGQGGNVVLVADRNVNTLVDFRFRRLFKAKPGGKGEGSNKYGRNADDLLITVPLGTIVKDEESGQVMADLSRDGQQAIVAKGGRGGRGNWHFRTSANRTPTFAERGEPGEERWLRLELKVLADVGLLGYPSVGKSSILRKVSAAQPEVAAYHFTTLNPILGVVDLPDHRSFVMADIPGIIEGASEGAGLGHDFLRHIDRCRLLVHVVDVSGSEGRDPVADFDAINAELSQYSPDLAKRPQIVAANKVDIMADPENLERLRAHVEAKGFPLLEISAAAHQGTRELVSRVAEMLSTLPPVTVYESEYVPKPPVVDTSAPLDIQRMDDGHTWLIQGPWLQRLMANVNFDDYESRMWFDKALRETGLYQQLEERGIEDGDTVSLDGYEFEYQR